MFFQSFQHSVHQISPYRIFYFYTDLLFFTLEKLVLLSFRGYLDEIESEEIKPRWKISYIYIY